MAPRTVAAATLAPEWIRLGQSDARPRAPRQGFGNKLDCPPQPQARSTSPSHLPRDREHAEGDIFSQFIRKAKERGLRPSDVEGKLVIHVSNPNGVCPVCRWGLTNLDARPGLIKQFSELYPKVTIEFSVVTEPGIKTIGPSHFTI